MRKKTISVRLNDKEMNTGTLTADTERAKLFYQYPTTVNNSNGSNLGYEVGPSNISLAKDGYHYTTSNYSVKTDSEVDSMYYPGSGNYYWLASPSAYAANSVMFVLSYSGGYVNYDGYGNGSIALCPLVSLQSSVTLELQ